MSGSERGPLATAGSQVLRVSGDPANLSRIRRFVEGRARELGADATSVDDIVQAVDESATNIIQHGYRHQVGDVEVEVSAADGGLVVRLRDHAPSFDPTRVPSPVLDAPLERRPLGGMGVHLTRELTDEVRYGRPQGWTNELTLVKRFHPLPTPER